MKWISLLSMALILSGCSYVVPKEAHQSACALYDFDDDWQQAAEDSAEKWGTPPHILLAFVKQESGFREDVRPPRDYFMGLIPLPRRSSAYGYAQAQDPVWNEYLKENGLMFASREDIHDSLDFIGWYNYKSYKRNGISRTDAKNLYLAYHEGHGGFKRKTYKSKPWLVKVSQKVAKHSQMYKKQLSSCGSYKAKKASIDSQKKSVQGKSLKRDLNTNKVEPCTAPWPFC